MSDSDSSTSSEENVPRETLQEKFRLFGRKKPVHSALGGGKSADILLWRNKQISGGLLASGTVIWLLFERKGYYLIPFLCHSLILSLATLFLWSNISFFLHKSAYDFPEIALPEDLCTSVALVVMEKCNAAFVIFRSIAEGNDFKKFLKAIFGLWIGSIFCSWFDFLTLVYIMFVMVLTMPLMYEKHEDQVDSYAQKATVKLQRQYSALDEKVLKKLPKVKFVANPNQN